MPELIGLAEVANRLSVDVRTVRRLIAQESETLAIEIQRGKGDKVLLSKDDSEKLIASYLARRGPQTGSLEETAKFDRFGYFYLIQLIPEALPKRIKIGFADNVERRLNEHRTAAPTAKVLKSWPCKRSWDYAAMDCITREGCSLVLNEVFEGDVDGFVRRGEEFFALMPNPDTQRELSEHSPLFDPSDATQDLP
jgi:T5orf172 domain